MRRRSIAPRDAAAGAAVCVDAAHLQTFVSRTYAINFKQKVIAVELNGSLIPYVKLFGRAHSPEFAKKEMTFEDKTFELLII